MKLLKHLAPAIGLTILVPLLSGCNQSLSSIAPTKPPLALPSAATAQVNSGQLPPINSNQQIAENQRVASAPTTPENQPIKPIPTEMANGTATDASGTIAPISKVKVTREGMAGSWQVPTDGNDCRIILAFTKWSGGYRAATRRCSSPEIQTINAWDVKDQSVVLVDQSGNEVARLFASNSGRYDGRTRNGQPVSFTR